MNESIKIRITEGRKWQYALQAHSPVSDLYGNTFLLRGRNKNKETKQNFHVMPQANPAKYFSFGANLAISAWYYIWRQQLKLETQAANRWGSNARIQIRIISKRKTYPKGAPPNSLEIVLQKQNDKLASTYHKNTSQYFSSKIDKQLGLVLNNWKVIRFLLDICIKKNETCLDHIDSMVFC